MKREETSPSKRVWFASLHQTDWMKTARLHFYTTPEAKHTETCQQCIDNFTVWHNCHFEQTQAKHTRLDKEREGSNLYAASEDSEHRHSGAESVHQSIIQRLSWKYTWQCHGLFNSSARLRNMSSPPSGSRFWCLLVIKRWMILLEIVVEVLNHSIDSNLLNRFYERFTLARSGSWSDFIVQFLFQWWSSYWNLIFTIFESYNRPETVCFTFFKTFYFMFIRRNNVSK